MNDPATRQSVEKAINELKRSLEKYASQGVHSSAELARDTAMAIHSIGEHVVALDRRLEKLEANDEHWTTHGWEPPPGTDRRS